MWNLSLKVVILFFFLDGFDEIPNGNKDNVIKEISKFVSKYSENSFVITSREDEGINGFTEFIKYHIEPLKREEAYMLIRKYDDNGRVSENLIEEIENNRCYSVLEEFLENPLMVSLLYSSYHYKGIIQYKKHLFYRQVYDALYEGHDITKGSGKIHTKKSLLDVEDFNAMLSSLGYLSIKHTKISFLKDEMIGYIKQSAILVHQNVNAEKFLDDLLHAVPIFVKDGLEIRWSHKSFAEYYAAYFICYIEKDREKEIVQSMINSKNNTLYYNVMDFCYDMDNKLAREIFIYELVKDYVLYCDANIKNFDDMAEKICAYYNFIAQVSFVKTETNIMDNEKGNRSVSDKALKEAIHKIQPILKAPIGDISIVSKNFNTFMFLEKQAQYEVVKLLKSKNIDIFASITEKEYSMKFWQKLNPGIYLWNGTQNDILKTNVKAIASYMCHHVYFTYNVILDYDKCAYLKQKIEQEMEETIENIYKFD